MNSCDRYQELISRLVDGEISRDEHEALMEHLKSCSSCNAMYAVFHDLSDILAEEPEELPEGLHENIMADVRRSALLKKNRRMRSIGLRTTLTAAACLVLVLFAAGGFAPGKRAESVSIRREQALEAMTPTPTAAPTETPAASAPAEYLPPAPFRATAAPAETPTPRQQPAALPAAEDSSEAQPAEPEQPDVYTTYPETWPTSASVQTPAPRPAQTPAPLPVQTPASAPAQFVPASQPTESPEAPALPAAADSQPGSGDVSADGEEAANDAAAPQLFSFTGDTAIFQSAAAGADQGEPEEDSAAPDEAEAAPEIVPFTVPVPMPETTPDVTEPEEPSPAPEADAPAHVEQSVSVYGKEGHDRLLALLGGRADTLPEAGLTRSVRISLVPDDEFGSTEQLVVRIYGDFLFYEYCFPDGRTACYRAACAVRDLDALLLLLPTTPPSPAPTADVFGGVPQAE